MEIGQTVLTGLLGFIIYEVYDYIKKKYFHK